MSGSLRRFRETSDGYSIDESHPNAQRWNESRRTALIRGELVVRLLGPLRSPDGARVLDIGCGDGGTSIAFALRGSIVTATDGDPRRINTLRQFIIAEYPQLANVQTHCVMGEELPFASASFDIAVLQCVLEHVQEPQRVLREICRVLAPGGIAFITVPNRWSFINWIADPHWGLPLIGMLNRRAVSYVITRVLRRETWRPDVAELLSLTRMKSMLDAAGLAGTFLNKEAAREMFRRPEAVVWTAFERAVVRWAARSGIDRIAAAIVSNSWSIPNFFVTPTWYIAARK